jgi:methylenetetrahydrofolate reductase (NADPH)
MAFNPVRDALSNGRFCHFVELVASRTMREANLLQSASDFAHVPEVTAGSVSSYAGGAMGHQPIRIGTAVRARGLTPNIHLTCVNHDRLGLYNQLQDLAAIGIENLFAVTGDYPKAAGSPPPVFDLDSVQLVEMINEVRQQTGVPFFISVAVSPFKYTEADCAYQYLKLEKKIAAGADYAITQVGFDARKFRELKRYLDERGLKTPVLGNVYVLPLRTAERMAKGEPPGCWVAPELVERIRTETQAADRGVAARLERGARMVAILRGLGYAGAYFGGGSKAENVRWMIKRGEELAPRWEELAEELNYAPKKAFYLYDTLAPPAKPLPVFPRFLDTMAKLFPVKRQETGLSKFLASLLGWVDQHPIAARGLEKMELAFKAPVFGCKDCGNCVLGEMEYVCPMTCPKNMRNGPCGGTLTGTCEVIDQPCIWVNVYDRAKSANRLAELKLFIPPPNRALKGTSSFINLLLKRDVRPGSTAPLVHIEGTAFGMQARVSDAVPTEQELAKSKGNDR